MKQRRMLRGLTAVATLALAGVLVVWVRSYFVVDVLQSGSAYVIRLADEMGRGGAVGARLHAMVTAPGAVYFFRQRNEFSGGELDRAKTFARFEGVDDTTWATQSLDAMAKSQFARQTAWPRVEFHWRTDTTQPGTSTSDVAIPLWALAAPLVIGTTAGWIKIARHWRLAAARAVEST